MKKHINIPVFIPHLGCPNSCVFCNQRTISGVSDFDPLCVSDIIDDALKTVDENTSCELAFFGGSFTGIERELMIYLLETGNRCLKSGRINSIRCSTRPDYINDEILKLLREYGVETVELGLQSISDHVLSLSERGHTSREARAAVELIKAHGLRVGGQMMIGLPGATIDDEILTARFIAESGCDEARIYPTVVFKQTALCDMQMRGIYVPLSLEEAVKRSAAAFEILVSNGVKILRVGLCDSENLHSSETYYAGPNHPAIGELVENEYYLKLLSRELDKYKTDGMSLTLTVPRGHTSKVIGQKKRNKNLILREYGLRGFAVRESDGVPPYSLLLKIEERK